MTMPPKTLRSLDSIATGHTYFEKDQVLTAGQLNGITEYLDDQQRITRTGLLGTGILSGFDLRLAGDNIVVGRGVGVTSDGDLLALGAAASFDRYRVYDEKAPLYPPFYPAGNADGTGRMMQLFELVRAGEKDPAAKALATLPVKPGERVAMLYLESYRNDPDLCSGTDCDNLGQQTINTLRVLLVSRSDAARLADQLAGNNTAALSLPELAAARPLFRAAVSSTAAFAELYRTACAGSHAALTSNLGLLYKALPALFLPELAADPTSGWLARLDKLHAHYAGQDAGIQYYYGFLKDLVETWNALRNALADDDCVLWPDVNAFPKHLLLGGLSSPHEARTGWHPSPLTGKRVSEHARFLALKLHTLITSFEPPAAGSIAVTPSRSESVPLEQRAIPYYYVLRSEFPIHLGWCHERVRRGMAARTPGYRAAEYGDKQNPLTGQIGGCDFFRIEGHLGQPVGDAHRSIEQAIRDYNLPFAVRAVLLHTERKHIAIRPPMRYGDLHRIHQILRRDLTLQLEDAKQFNGVFRQRIEQAVESKQIADQNVIKTASSRHGEIAGAVEEAAVPLAKSRYSDYRQARQSRDWSGAYGTLVNSAGNFKGTLGELVQADLPTVFDTLVTNRHPDWLGWMDILIKAKDDSEDDKLLFPEFVRQHPGLEHAGGVARGGTFVLVYDDKASVVADFALSYLWPESAENEPDDETVLPNPDFRKPGLRDDIFRLRPTLDASIDARLKDFELKLEPKWMAQINIQKEHMTFFKESVGALTELAGNKSRVVGMAANYADKMVEYGVNDIETKSRQVETLRQMVMDQEISGAAREQANKKLLETQAALADSIAETTTYLVDNKLDLTASADGGRALGSLTQGMGMVTDGAVRAQLGTRLAGIQAGADAISKRHALVVGGLIEVGGLKTR
ncbi:MAG: hypothetical protein PHH47_02630 [Gallionella sp.]|nr:hypothetical protein [Gallionella sp.]MDD4946093.1 hypothetical protein [Gallionella sp.]MDD5611901.1 hypothetical protein [Gallionella sp.]